MKLPLIKKKLHDERINVRYPVWIEYIAILFVMLCLSGGQGMILFSFIELPEIPIECIFANIGYWSLITTGFCLIIYTIRKRTFDKPMTKLSEAAKQVAQGNFSVRLGSLRKDGKKDYVEVMFDDFNTMAEELGSIEMLTTDFISNVSHEIKTPLSVIQSYAAALQKTDLPEDTRKEYTDTIMTASSKLNTLVVNILKLSKLENQVIPPSFKEFNLCAQLAECVLMFEERIGAKQINFNVEMDDRCVIRADKDLLSVVWDNLLSNAIKFTDNGGAVTLTQTSETGSVTVTVSDTGSGIDEKAISRIFDKFYQGDTSHNTEGNGLGLALAKRVVEIHGGEISARSELGKGSEFCVKLKITP